MHVLDGDRPDRIGMPEAVLCLGKSDAQLCVVIEGHLQHSAPVLLTRLSTSQFERLPEDLATALDHDADSQTAIIGGRMQGRPGTVAVVAAGTSDHLVVAEAARTLTFSGIEHEQFIDVGVAGLWRLEQRLPEIRLADVVIAVAGMDAALVSVLGGLLPMPVIAVPTSVGYGVAADGSTALNSALASCAQGVTVVNIDNGFGAACAAVRVLSLLDLPDSSS